GAGAARRRQEQALLRARGATTRALVGLGIAEALAAGLPGAAVGLCLAALAGAVMFDSAAVGATTGPALLWTASAVAIGLGIALAGGALPAGRDARERTVRAAGLAVGRPHRPRWLRWGLDVVLLAGGLVVFAVTTRQGYQLVLAPEGVPTISVSYWAFAG